MSDRLHGAARKTARAELHAWRELPDADDGAFTERDVALARPIDGFAPERDEPATP